MVTLYSKIIGANVVDITSQEKVGTVFDLIYDPEKITIAGVILDKSFFSRSPNVIAACNLVEISGEESVVLIEDAESLQDLNDLVRLKSKYEKGLNGVGQKVYTKSGEYLGKVYDILIDNLTFEIKKLYIKNLITERIISRLSVIEFGPKKIVIKDNFETARVRAVVETSLI